MKLGGNGVPIGEMPSDIFQKKAKKTHVERKRRQYLDFKEEKGDQYCNQVFSIPKTNPTSILSKASTRNSTEQEGLWKTEREKTNKQTNKHDRHDICHIFYTSNFFNI